MKGLKEFLALIEKYKNVNREVDDELEKKKKILSDLEKAQRALAKAQSEEAVEVQKLRVQTAELNRSNKETAKSALGMVTPYQKFAKEVNDAKKQAKSLGAEMLDLENRFKRGEISSKEYNKEINRLSKEYTEARLKAMGLDTQLKKLDASVGDNQRNVGNYRSAVNGIAGGFKNLIAAFGVVSAVDMFADLTRKSYETVKALNAQNAALIQVFETEAQVARQKEFLADITNRLGLDLVSTTDTYVKFSAAVKGTALEGEKARNIFESFAGASARLGLNTEEQAGIFKALEQMISKGKIQAEELRGQLGDRMAGAFALFANAIGVTTSELDEMLKKGEVTSDILNDVSKNLNEVYNLDKSTNIDTLAAAQNRLTNEWNSFLDGIAGNKDLVNSLADGLDVLGDVISFLLDTLIADGEDGVSVLGDVLDIIGDLIGAVGDIAEGLGLMDEKTKNNLFSLRQFKNDLNSIRTVIAQVTAVIKYLAETITNFFGTMFQDDGWAKFNDRMDASAAKLTNLWKQAEKAQDAIAKANKEDKVYNGEADAYQKAWAKAKKEKVAFFQYEGKYFSSQTGRNTGKSTDDYIDVKYEGGTKLELKPKAAPLPKGGSGSSTAAADRERKRREKEAERESKRLAKLAETNAKAEIDAQKLSLEFLRKSFNEEKALTDQKEVFYSYYYKRKQALLIEERDIDLKYAKTAGEKQKILQKFQIAEIDLEREKQEKLKAIRIQALESEKAFYKAKNISVLEIGIELTDALVENEKRRIEDLAAIEKQSISEKYQLNEEDLLAKLANNERLTDAEKLFYSEITDLHRKTAEEKENIDSEYYDSARIKLEQAIEFEKNNLGFLYDFSIEKKIEHEQKLYDAEKKTAADRYTAQYNKIIQEITDAEVRAEAIKSLDENYFLWKENAEAEHQQKLNEIRNDAFDSALEAQGEFVQNIGQIKNIEVSYELLKNAKMIESDQDRQAAYMAGTAMMLNSLKSFAREGSATWKTMAVFEATLNMFAGITSALREVRLDKKILGIALATATGMMAINNIKNTPNPRYEHGTLFAERTTMATVDEKGPELHFDKHWRLKDVGKNTGPRMKQVVQGDKILPADISAMIMKLNLQKSDSGKTQKLDIDYQKLGNIIAEKNQKIIEKSKKEHYVVIDGELVRIETKGNMRVIYRDRESPKPQRLL